MILPAEQGCAPNESVQYNHSQTCDVGGNVRLGFLRGFLARADRLCADSARPLACGTYFFEGYVHTLAQH